MSVHVAKDHGHVALCGARVGYLMGLKREDVGWVSDNDSYLVSCTKCIEEWNKLPTANDALEALGSREFVALAEKL